MVRGWLLAIGLVLFVGLGSVEAQTWTHEIFGRGDDLNLTGKIALAPDGSVVGVGSVDTTNDPHEIRWGTDAVIAKLDPTNGAEIWRATYSGLGLGDDYFRGVAIDAAGDIIAGGVLDDGNQGAYAVVKVSGANGTEIWRTSIDGLLKSYDQVEDVVVDRWGNVFAIGKTINDPTGIPTLTAIKLRGGDGLMLWRRDIDGYDNAHTITGATVTLDVAGDVIAGFGSYDMAWEAGAFSVAKLASTDGSMVWRYDEPEGAAEVRAVAVTAGGDVIAAGAAVAPIWSVIVVRINGSNGSEVWLRKADGGLDLNGAEAFGMAIDSRGDVVIAGTRVGNLGYLNFVIAKFDGAAGTTVWQQAIQGDQGPSSIAFNLAIDRNDDIIGVGAIDDSPVYGMAAPAAVKFAGVDGTVLWRQQFGGYPNGGGHLMWVTLDAAGDAYAIGNYFNRSPASIVVAKFDSKGGPVPLPGDLFRMRDATNPSLKSLTIATRSGSVTSMPSSSSDPRDSGATLKISNPSTGESTTIRLPAAGWAPSGGPMAAKGFVYREAKKGNGPCNIVRVRKGRSLKIACKGAGIDFSLDEAKQHTLQVELITGPLRQCMRFGGVVADEPGTFRARKAYRPESCD